MEGGRRREGQMNKQEEEMNEDERGKADGPKS